MGKSSRITVTVLVFVLINLILLAVIAGVVYHVFSTQCKPCGPKLSVSNSQLMTASHVLWNLDVNSAKPGDIVYNLQGKTKNNARDDVAPYPFFSYVNETILTEGTFAKLEALQDNYNRTQGYSEVITDEELQEQEDFLDAVLATKVGKYLFDFLDSKNAAGCNGIDGFKVILKNIWFEMYDRRAPHDTSGFEHSFVGEIKVSKVSGFHNWVSFYRQEQAGNLNYQGYLSYTNASSDIVGMRHTWYGAVKSINGFTIGTSPEIELALYTLCHLYRPAAKCDIQIGDINGNPVDTSIQTYTWSKSFPPVSSFQMYVGSAYFFA